MLKFLSHSETETIAFAERFAATLEPGDVVALSGELGVGKSVFCRAIIRALGVVDEALPSPTFAIIQEYEGSHGRIAHMDWYRLEAATEIGLLGVREFFQPPWVCLIEWSERASELLPGVARHVTITCVEGDFDGRLIEITG